MKAWKNTFDQERVTVRRYMAYRMNEDHPAQKVPQNMSQDHLFLKDALGKEDHDYREYLIRILERRLGRRIKSTRLVTYHDPINDEPANIHNYIDGKENLVLVFKLTNGIVLAAWTQAGFTPEEHTKGDGAILSLTNRRTYQPIQKNTGVTTYHDDHVIFGKS